MICSICLDKIQDEQKIITECNHTFHNDCLLEWYKYKRTCPMCRSECNISLSNFEYNLLIMMIIIMMMVMSSYLYGRLELFLISLFNFTQKVIKEKHINAMNVVLK